MVAAEHEARRDGRFLEIIGTYNPMVDPPALEIKEDRVRHWVAKGAKPSELVRSLIKQTVPNLVEEKEKAQRDKIVERRKARKKRTGDKTDPKRAERKEKRKQKRAKKAK